MAFSEEIIKQVNCNWYEHENTDFKYRRIENDTLRQGKALSKVEEKRFLKFLSIGI